MKADPGLDTADVSTRVPLRVLIVEDFEDDAKLVMPQEGDHNF